MMFQPMMLLAAILVFRSFSTRWITNCLLLAYSVTILWSGAILLFQYERHSINMTTDLFGGTIEVAGRGRQEPFVLVTPLTSGFYSYLGSSLSFGYANSGWGPIFKGEERNWPIGFYYSCDIEGQDRCAVIRQSNFVEKELYLTDLTVDSLLDEAGRIRGEALEELVIKRFGVATRL